MSDVIKMKLKPIFYVREHVIAETFEVCTNAQMTTDTEVEAKIICHTLNKALEAVCSDKEVIVDGVKVDGVKVVEP